MPPTRIKCGIARKNRNSVVSRLRFVSAGTTLTETGIQTLHANPARLREVNRDVEEMGAKVLHQWAALGEYDFVNIVEAPDDVTIAKVSVALGARGSAKLESLPLISVDDFLGTLT